MECWKIRGKITRLIEYDPAISSRLLKIVNSAVYGQTKTVENVKKAISILGTRRLHDLVLAITIARSFQSIADINYDVNRFWQNSVTRACVAKACALELHNKEPDNLFISGLLSDIGHMVMSIRSPDLMESVLLQHRKAKHPLHLYERSTFGFDYGELGADILENWSIPDSIAAAIRYQNCPELAPEYQHQAAILYCASRLHPDETEFPNVIDVETLKQAGISGFNYENARAISVSLIEDALSLFAIAPIKQAV